MFKNKILITMAIMSSLYLNADVCGDLTSIYSSNGSYNEYIGSTDYNGKKVGRLYLHPEDCDDEDENDINLSSEAVPCESSDVDFTSTMSELYNSTVDTNIDSTIFQGYGTNTRRFIDSAKSNSSGRFCKPKTVYYDGGYNADRYCDIATNITVDTVLVAQDIDVPEKACVVDVPKRLKVGQYITVSNSDYSVSGESDSYYTFGFATLRCELSKSDGKPYLYVVPNDNSICDNTNADSSFYENAARDCNNLCYWGEDLHCPETEVRWGDDDKCKFKTGLGYIGDEISAESQSHYEGNANYTCSFAGVWVQINESASSCSN